MRPRIISLTCLLMAATMMAAQSIKRHEYWIDTDYSSRQTESSGSTVSMTVSTAGLSPGVHFFNHRALNSDDTWGVLSRMLFYVPDLPAGAVSVSSYEYWIDSDHANRTKGVGNSEVTASVDVSKLSAGLHFFNFQAVNSHGDGSCINRYAFYIPERMAALAKVEYWLDNDHANAVKKETADVSQSFTIDISKLPAGIHYFNFRTIDANGCYGKLMRSVFFIPMDEPSYVTEYQYWIDDAEPTVKTAENAQTVFELALDVSALAEGEHTFSFQARSVDGNWGELFIQTFTIDNAADDEIITFACSVAESICVANWDTSGDGKLSKTEAAAVTSLGEVFKESEIASFNELQYFTGLTKIDDNAFENCTKLASVELPATVTQIGTHAFVECPFTEISFPSALTKISSEAFLRCQSLKSIQIPSSVESMANGSFASCTAVESIVVEEGNEFYDSREGCNAIIRKSDQALIRGCKNTVIPSGVEIISFAAFQWTPLEGAFVVPEGVKSIGQSAFVSTTLSSISLPSTLTYIGGWSFQDCNNLESVDIPNGITSIGDYTFSYCDKLATVSIPENVTEIGNLAFASCTVLKEFRVYAKEPPTLGVLDETASHSEPSSVFMDVDKEACTLYVPVGSKEKYEQADGWSEFTNIVEMGETYDITIGKNGKTTFCGDKSLDFSYSDEVKAFIATGFDKTEGTIWMTRVKDVPAGVPVMIKGTAEETYHVPVTEGGSSYYKNMFVGNTTGESMSIGETSEDGQYVNYYMSGGQFKSVKTSANIGANKCYLQLPATFAAEATGDGCQVKIAASGKSSFAAPYDLDFNDLGDLKAFTATGYDKSTKTIWLTRVMKVQKGEGLLLKGTGGATYTIPSSGVQAAYVNMIIGNTSGEEIKVYEKSEDGAWTNYYLKGGTYMSVNGSANIGNNKSYLQLPTYMLAGARGEDAPDNVENLGISGTLSLTELETESMPLIFGSTTGIRTTDCTDYTDESHAVWYDLQGRKYDAQPTKKGIYIHKGRKVVVK